jgi:predicted dehydrogenase
MRIGICGSGQFAGSFAKLWSLHPDVDGVYATDLLPERAKELVDRAGLDGTFDSYDAMLDSADVDAVVVMTQRWTHYELVMQALNAGKDVFSAVPMAQTVDECRDIVSKVAETGLIYMMGETSYYNPAVIWARSKIGEGFFGRLFYAEGDYVHDMDHGFYSAFQYSGGENWKATASYPPMLYPTHAVGGVLGALPTYAASVSCIGISDDRGDGVFDTELSLWGNDFSNMSALFQLADGSVMRTNEFRRVGHAAGRESRFRFYGTKAVMEQGTRTAHYTTSALEGGDYVDLTELFATDERQLADGQGPSNSDHVAGLDPALLASFESGMSPVHDRSRLPKEFEGAPNGHEGAHHFLAADFVTAITTRAQPPINAWLSARFTIPGIVALESARSGGARLDIPDLGDQPG